MMQRIVAAETLDGLAENDPAAMRSRRDLQRVHRVMGTRGILLAALTDMTRSRSVAAPMRVLELGAGDGTLMLGVAEALALAPSWPRVEITLLDRQSLIDQATVDRYARCGWTVKKKIVDVMDWAVNEDAPDSQLIRCDVIVTNLFLHHFDSAPLRFLMNAMAARCNRLFACEPRRAGLALLGSHLIGAIGANAVTREDAVLSVRAGFCDHELTRLWPSQEDGWRIREYSAGLFSHCFRAERVGAT